MARLPACGAYGVSGAWVGGCGRAIGRYDDVSCSVAVSVFGEDLNE